MKVVRAGFGLAAVAVVAALALVGVASGEPAATTQSTQKVTVTMTEYKFALKPKTVKKGTVVFTTVNKGTVAHDFKVSGKKTPNVKAGKKGTLKVTFKKAGKYPYLCTLPSHAQAGMKGVLVVKA